MDTRTFTIPATNKQLVIEHIEKLNKRVKKLFLPPITLTWGRAFYERRSIKGLEIDIVVLPCDLTGPLSVSFDGWQFVATLQHLPTGENILRTISEEFPIPSEYKNCGSNCEHCKVNRYRKDTYLVRHEGSKFMQVGSSCIKDFLGGNSPDDILKRASLAAEIISFMDGAEGDGGGGGSIDEGIFHIETFLAQTVACIRDYGWLSKSEAKSSDNKSTASWVLDNFYPPSNRRFNFSVINDAEKDKARKAAEWAENLSDEECEASDYLHNIRAIARSGMVGIRTAGFAASIISSYDRDLARRQPRLMSTHVGSIKMRDEFDLTLKSSYQGVSDYGVFFKYIFKDEQGNVFVWLSSNEQDFEVDQKYRIRGTIKKHSEFKGTKQTEINRCEVVFNHG
jgi:hypothetical protein